MRSFRILFLALVCVAGTLAAGEQKPAAASNDEDAMRIGRAVLAVDAALGYQLPANPTAAEQAKSDALTRAAVEAGQLTQLYPWVSGRIQLEISIAEHLLADTRPEPARAEALQRRLKYLRRLKLLIDAPL